MISRNEFAFLTCTVTVCLIIVCFLSTNTSADSYLNEQFGSKGIGVGESKISFFYCYSCGYKKAFEDYANIIHQRYPHMTVQGSNYDPPGMNFYLSKVILVSKLLLILVIMSAYNVWGYLGQGIPAWYRWCTENKLYACMMIFFVGNMLEAQLISSGAFEISFNDLPVWSKLETGRIPSPQELFQIIDSHLTFTKQIPDVYGH